MYVCVRVLCIYLQMRFDCISSFSAVSRFLRCAKKTFRLLPSYIPSIALCPATFFFPSLSLSTLSHFHFFLLFFLSHSLALACTVSRVCTRAVSRVLSPTLLLVICSSVFARIILVRARSFSILSFTHMHTHRQGWDVRRPFKRTTRTSQNGDSSCGNS